MRIIRERPWPASTRSRRAPARGPRGALALLAEAAAVEGARMKAYRRGDVGWAASSRGATRRRPRAGVDRCPWRHHRVEGGRGIQFRGRDGSRALARPPGSGSPGRHAHRARSGRNAPAARRHPQARDPAALAAEVQAISDPGSPEYRHFLTPAQFAHSSARRPPPSTQVTSALQQEGLTVGPPSSTGLSLPVSGTVAQVQSAFSTPISNTTCPRERPATTTRPHPRSLPRWHRRSRASWGSTRSARRSLRPASRRRARPRTP